MALKEFIARNGAILNDKVSVVTGANTYFNANATGTTIGAVLITNGSINVASNVFLSNTSLFIGNSTVNTTANNLALVSNALMIRGIINVGSNISITTSQILLGNSTVNVVINSSAVSGLSNFVAGGNVALTTTGVTIGNSTVNSYHIVDSLNFSNSTVTSNLTLASLNLGANVVMSLSSFVIGNSTVNSISNSTFFAVRDTLSTGLVNSTQISVGSNSAVQTSRYFQGNSTVNTIISSTITVQNSTYIATIANWSGQWVGPSGNVQIRDLGVLQGNSTVNAVYNLTSIGFANSTLTSNLQNGTLNLGDNVSVNTIRAFFGNSTVNTIANSADIRISNATSFTYQHALAYHSQSQDTGTAQRAYFNYNTGFVIGNTTYNAVQLSNTTLLIQSNSTVNAVVNTSGLYVSGSLRSAFGNTTQAGVVELAVNTEYLATTSANLALTPNAVWSAANLTTLTDAATVATDMSTGINFTVTLAGNRTLGAPTNTTPGKAGFIRIVQDGTGSRTLAYNSVWKFAGSSAPTLSTNANAIDYLDYFVANSTHIRASLSKNWG